MAKMGILISKVHRSRCKCKRKTGGWREGTHRCTRTHTLGRMCRCNDLFRIQSVHLQRIIDPDGHWMNNATPAEGHSTIMFSFNKTKTQGHTAKYLGKAFELEQEAAYFNVWNVTQLPKKRVRTTEDCFPTGGARRSERFHPEWALLHSCLGHHLPMPRLTLIVWRMSWLHALRSRMWVRKRRKSNSSHPRGPKHRFLFKTRGSE